MTPFTNPEVERAFNDFPYDARTGLLELRELIFKVARETEGVGEIEETLKWGQPAYLTPQTKSGSTIRLGLPKKSGQKPGQFTLYTHCQTSILSEFQSTFPGEFVYEGNRAIHFQATGRLPLDQLELLIRRALTYHMS